MVKNSTEIDKDDFKCPICLDIFIKPVIDKCGHTFCKKCILNHLKSNFLCPLSKDLIGKNDFYPNLLLNRLLDKFKFDCDICKDKIIYSKLKKHKKICLYKRKKKEELITEIIDLKKSLKNDKINKFLNLIKKKKINIDNLKKILKTEKSDFIRDRLYKYSPGKINNLDEFFLGHILIEKNNIDFIYFFKFSKNSKLIKFF